MDSRIILSLARASYPNNEGLRVAHMLGIEKGYAFCKEQMMKGAVDAEEVGRNIADCPIYLAKTPVDTTKHGDKVKLIIINK